MVAPKNVLIHSPGFFGRQQMIARKTCQIEEFNTDMARAALTSPNTNTFYTIGHFKSLFSKACEESDFKVNQIGVIQFLLYSLNLVVSELDSSDITAFIKQCEISHEQLLVILKNYPELAKKLSFTYLLERAQQNVNVAKYILSNPDLARIIDQFENNRYRIYQAHKSSLWLCSKVFGLNDVERYEQYSQSRPERGLPENWNQLKQLFRRRRELKNEKNKLEECTLYLNKLIDTLQKKQKLNPVYSVQMREIDDILVPIINNVKVTLKYKYQKDIQTDDIVTIKHVTKRIYEEVLQKQQEIDNTLRQFHDLSEQMHFGKYTLDIFLLYQNNEISESQAKQNVFDLMALAPRYMALIDERHVEAMLALVSNSEQFLKIIQYLVSYNITRRALCKVLNAARLKNNLPVSDENVNTIQQRAFDRIYQYIYRENILLKEEAVGRRKILSFYPTVAKAIYRNQPTHFIKLFEYIHDRDSRIHFLESCSTASFIDTTLLLYISSKMNDPKERKRYFYNGERDIFGRMPGNRLCSGIEELLNRKFSKSDQIQPLSDEEHQLLCNELAKDDLRGWVDLARSRNDDRINYVARWLEVAPKKMPDGNLNDEVSKIIAQDRNLLSTIRRNITCFERDYATRNDYLFAANFVQKHIEASQRWFEGRRQDDFIERFISWVRNPPNNSIMTTSNPYYDIDRDKRAAVCWYITNHKELMSRLEARCVRKSRWFNSVSVADEESDKLSLEFMMKIGRFANDLDQPSTKGVGQQSFIADGLRSHEQIDEQTAQKPPLMPPLLLPATSLQSPVKTAAAVSGASSSADSKILTDKHYQSNEVFFGLTEEKPIYFNREKIADDGNCGITGLGTTRQELVVTLLALVNNREVRESLEQEIHQAFISEEIMPPSDEWQRLLQTRTHLQGELDKVIRTIRDKIPEASQFDGEQRRELIAWLQANDQGGWSEKLRDQVSAIDRTENAIREYCCGKEVYKYYINSFISETRRLWIGHASALAFAKAKQITLYIWEQQGKSNQLILKNKNVESEPHNVVHLFYTGRSTHFDLLVETVAPIVAISKSTAVSAATADALSPIPTLLSSANLSQSFFKSTAIPSPTAMLSDEQIQLNIAITRSEEEQKRTFSKSS